MRMLDLLKVFFIARDISKGVKANQDVSELIVRLVKAVDEVQE